MPHVELDDSAVVAVLMEALTKADGARSRCC